MWTSSNKFYNKTQAVEGWIILQQNWTKFLLAQQQWNLWSIVQWTVYNSKLWQCIVYSDIFMTCIHIHMKCNLDYGVLYLLSIDYMNSITNFLVLNCFAVFSGSL